MGSKECKAVRGSEDLLTMNEPPCHILKSIVMFPISSIFHVFIISKDSAFLLPPGILYIMHAYFFQTSCVSLGYF